MNHDRLVAMPTPVAELARSTKREPGYGHPAFTEVTRGYGPCRHCLHFFPQREKQRTCFTYNPFHGLNLVPVHKRYRGRLL